MGYHVAVLAVDPTSPLTGGSILGDKTRMQNLSREPNCFIRPSPSQGTLGGVARKSRETMMLCEAAGYDVILVETVGVGQSETTVRNMVDFFMLLVLTGAGDDLQGIKKGIMELADAIVVNKADGDNLTRATVAQGEYERMVEFIRPATEGWKTHAYKCSALTQAGLPELWAVMRKFEKRRKLRAPLKKEKSTSPFVGPQHDRRASAQFILQRSHGPRPYPAGGTLCRQRARFAVAGSDGIDPLLRYGPRVPETSGRGNLNAKDTPRGIPGNCPAVYALALEKSANNQNKTAVGKGSFLHSLVVCPSVVR